MGGAKQKVCRVGSSADVSCGGGWLYQVRGCRLGPRKDRKQAGGVHGRESRADEPDVGGRVESRGAMVGSEREASGGCVCNCRGFGVLIEGFGRKRREEAICLVKRTKTVGQ